MPEITIVDYLRNYFAIIPGHHRYALLFYSSTESENFKTNLEFCGIF